MELTVEINISIRSLALKNILKINKFWLVTAASLLLTGVVVTSANAAPLTASTSLTIVNVTWFPFSSVDITRWGGAWPTSPDATLTSTGKPNPSGKELYLNEVFLTRHSIWWDPIPRPTPYTPFGNGINSMICAVWSDDGGKTFGLGSWDYLAPTTDGKVTEQGMPNCWMGTIVHTLCDRKPGECNGRYRSNLIFEEWPSGNTSCWGIVK